MADTDTRGITEGTTEAEASRMQATDLMPLETEPRPLQAPERDPRIAALMQELDLTDTQSVLFFGSKAQQQLTAVSERMLEGVRNKDVGPAGEALSEMITTLRGFDVEELDPNRRQGLLDRLFRKAKPVVKFLQEYDEVRNQIERVSDELERHKTRLLHDVTALDRLYDANLEYFRTLEHYIAAGEEKLLELDQTLIPELARAVEQDTDMVRAQSLRDLRVARDDLERRVHDLRLTRQVAMQSLPSIRLVQENDKGLINKINSTLVNTVPLWRQQLAQAVTIYRSSRAAASVKAATDLTNELLRANAENLRQANAEARREIERGVFDIEAIKQANQSLIDTIQESLSIADEGRRARAEATQQLRHLEEELRKSLAAAGARSGPPSPAPR